jgi:predicted metal-binding membrane protein
MRLWNLGMGPSTALLEAMIRRDRWVLLAGILVVSALAWGWLVLGSGMDMSAIDMTRMAGMDGWMMQQAVWTPAYALLIVSMWWVMMVAMMLPGAAPMLLLFAQVNRKEKVAGSPFMPTGAFAAGYLITWGGFSVVATGLQWALESARLVSPMLETTNVWLAAGILVGAGLWQLTPLKTMCLRHCRSPLGFLIGNWRAGRLGALLMGLEHGGYCLGCCWFLMALLFFGGVMNLYWIVGLAVFILLEKIIPLGHWLGRVAGVVLIGWGAYLLVHQ